MSDQPAEPVPDVPPLPAEAPSAPAPAPAPAPGRDRAADRRRAPRGRSRAASAADEAARDAEVTAPADVTRPPADRRPTGLRMARVHLRMGSLTLARAELESFAGRDAIDDDALLDLAEARWRTGDLAGAGEAADVLLARGYEDVLALVIAAEAVAELGRPTAARALAGRAMVAADGRLEAIFAGMPRSPIWPEDAPSVDGPATSLAGAGRERSPSARTGRPRPTGREGGGERTPASPAATEALAGGLAALGGGDVAHAALRLGVALRLEPEFADAVLEAIGDRAAEPHLALVAGDAHRLLGREVEALEAFDRARGHVDPRRPTPSDAPAPGDPPR